ncbi:hypothetical protein HK101_003497 [Irineochytrium annulatum]|nr:hypothetical protein HK101_003497 [Irineochytrium annulatum]
MSSAAAPSSSPPPTAATAVAAAKPKRNLAIHLLAGGIAGCCEALTCHPLDTIKVRLQLRGERASRVKTAQSLSGAAGNAANAAAAAAAKKPNNFILVGVEIVKKEGFFSLYKGLGAVVSGIVPKMAIRFSSFEFYKEKLADKTTGKTSSAGVFLAGLGAGTTESILVVTPMDVIKIRLQAQRHSMSDPLDVPKYRNAPHCAYVMIKEEGFASLYKGVALTVLRQATNQAANFTVYQFLKQKLHDYQPDAGATLPAYQHLLMGFISGACGPLFNAPIDTIKTRIQKNPSNESGWKRFMNVTSGIIKNEGWMAFYKGLTPRVLRVAPGQAITFMVYERVYKWMVDLSTRLKVEEASFTESNE